MSIRVWLCHLFFVVLLGLTQVAFAGGTSESVLPSEDAISCDDGGLYVVYVKTLAYRRISEADFKFNEHGAKIGLNTFCRYRPFIDLSLRYKGEGKPESAHYGLMVAVPDKSSIQKIVSLLPEAEVSRDTESYYSDRGWIVRSTSPLSLQEGRALKNKVLENEIPIEHVELFDDSALVFLGSCLSENEARDLLSLAKRLGISVSTVHLKMQELDM